MEHWRRLLAFLIILGGIQEDNTPYSFLMENSTAEWEYYYDYVDPVMVDQTKLTYNKYLIVIIFWIFLAVFVGLLFISLNLLSRIVTIAKNNHDQNKGSSS